MLATSWLRARPLPISLSSVCTCRAICFNLKSFNQCVQAALNQNVRPSPVAPNISTTSSSSAPYLPFPLSASVPSVPLRYVCRLSLVSTYPPSPPTRTLSLHIPRTSRNELIRQSDEGRANRVYVCACVRVCTYRCLTKRGVIPSRRFTVTKETRNGEEGRTRG